MAARTPLMMSSLLPLLLISAVSPRAMAFYSVVDFGARPDGRTDSAKAFQAAWAATCGANNTASMHVPSGMFFVSQALFKGPCNNTAISIIINGTIMAPSGYSFLTQWINFKYVEGLSIFGGTLDGRGQAFWACKTAGGNCPLGATSLTIGQSKSVLISGLTLLNSEMFHMSIFSSNGVTVKGSNILAPGDSPNTDGIHVQMSTGVTIMRTTIRTGDDCISMGAGSTNVWIEQITCGPGHGISIGSLGGVPLEAKVQNITVRSVVLTGTQNALRVKTWAKPNSGFVKEITFEHGVMKNVQNPIIFDQNYCPNKVNCPNQNSKIKISDVSFNNIQGSSATPVVVKFNCSSIKPCSGITLKDIKLTYQNKPGKTYCKNAQGTTTGFMIPPSCLG